MYFEERGKKEVDGKNSALYVIVGARTSYGSELFPYLGILIYFDLPRCTSYCTRLSFACHSASRQRRQVHRSNPMQSAGAVLRDFFKCSVTATLHMHIAGILGVNVRGL